MKRLFDSKQYGSLSFGFVLDLFKLLTIRHQGPGQCTDSLPSNTAIKERFSLKRFNLIIAVARTFYLLATFFENKLFLFQRTDSQTNEIFQIQFSKIGAKNPFKLFCDHFYVVYRACDELFEQIEIFEQVNNFFLINFGEERVLYGGHFLVHH